MIITGFMFAVGVCLFIVLLCNWRLFLWLLAAGVCIVALLVVALLLH